MYCPVQTAAKFLFFPVLRRGSGKVFLRHIRERFYSSPSCDGDPVSFRVLLLPDVSILPRLATGIAGLGLRTGIGTGFYSSPSCDGDQSDVV